MKNKKIIPFILFLIIVCFIFIRTFVKSRKEHLSSYNFKIEKIELSDTRSLVFFSNSERIFFVNFKMFKGSGIKKGDSISKPICSNIITVFRDKKQIISIKEKSLITSNLFCN